MKKFLLPALLLLAASQVSAQSLYIRGGIGYALPQAGQLFSHIGLPYDGNTTITYNGADYSANYDINKVSYSAGVHGYVAAGLMVTNNVGIELGADLGLATTSTSFTQLETAAPESSETTLEQSFNLPVLLSPAIVIQTGGKINFYARGGISIPVKAIMELKYINVDNVLNPSNNTTVRNTLDVTEEYNFTLTPGFNGAMGIKVSPVSKLSVWGEVSLLSMNMYTNESTVTYFRVTQAGNDVTSQYQIQRNTSYALNGSASNNTNNDYTRLIPFSNVGINVGVAVTLF